MTYGCYEELSTGIFIVWLFGLVCALLLLESLHQKAPLSLKNLDLDLCLINIIPYSPLYPVIQLFRYLCEYLVTQFFRTAS